MVNKIYALVGPYASGKSTLATQLISMGIHYIPTYTTKRFRKGEYPAGIFRTLDQDEFFKHQYMAHIACQGEYFGLRKDDLLTALQEHQVSLILLNVGAISQLNRLLKDRLVTIYLMADYITLVSRMLQKGCTNSDIKYQLEYAENNKIFDAYTETTHVVKNTQGPHAALAQILAIMGLTTLLPPTELAEHLR